MKKSKLFLFILGFLMLIPSVSANEKITVTLSKCVDGDTAKFQLNDEIITARFLAIDTPETKHPTKGEEPWGKEASNFTCNSLKKAMMVVTNKINIIVILFGFLLMVNYYKTIS